MNLGTTLEEKKQNYQALTRGAQKLGKIIGCFGVLIFVIVTFTAFNLDELSFFQKILFMLLGSLAIPAYYGYGYIAYYGYVTVKLWLLKKDIRLSDVAISAVDAMATVTGLSYLFGGRKAAKRSLIASLFLIAFVVTIGVFFGLYNYFKIRSEAKKLSLC